MKQFLLVIVLFIPCFMIGEVQAQTYANIPLPENVLVVYKLPDPNNEADTLSRAVKDYYKTARGIPVSNIFGLDSLVSHNITIGGVTHPVIIAEQGNIIRDELNHEWGTWYATQHAWKYFYQYIAAPIKEHIAANNLNSIRYIVLCKGVPFKIQAGADSSKVICNLTVGGLLSMLNTDNYDILLDSIYNKFRRNAIPD